jgi:hypothetical protein
MEPQEQELVTVYTVANAVEAEIIKNALEDEGIPCFVEGGLQAGEAGLAGIPVKIDVAVADAERARLFIEEHHQDHQEEPDEPGPDQPEPDEMQ